VLTVQDAINAVRETLKNDHDVIENTIIEKDYGWLIFDQNKEYLKSRKPSLMSLGSGGTLVEKNTGRLIKFGSLYSTETHFKIYEAGYMTYENYDLIVIDVSNRGETVRLLEQLQITYIKPEIEGTTIWKIPKKYTSQELLNRINETPCRFNLGSLYFNWQHIEYMRKSNSLKFELQENTGFCNEI